MELSINWPMIVGTLLVSAGGAWTLISGGLWLRRRRPASKAPTTSSRGADDPPPPGAVEWVADLVEAMGQADAEMVLQALKDGDCRDKARHRRIEQLEGIANPPEPVV